MYVWQHKPGQRPLPVPFWHLLNCASFPLSPCRNSWETIFSRSTELVSETEMNCCRRIVQLCRDCLLIVYQFAAEAKSGSAPVAPPSEPAEDAFAAQPQNGWEMLFLGRAGYSFVLCPWKLWFSWICLMFVRAVCVVSKFLGFNHSSWHYANSHSFESENVSHKHL